MGTLHVCGGEDVYVRARTCVYNCMEVPWSNGLRRLTSDSKVGGLIPRMALLPLSMASYIK